MKSKSPVLLLILLTAVGQVVGQNQPSPTATPSPTPEARNAEKANERPKEPERKPEPWDDADVSKMASQCVTFETAKGNITMELYPESAPETVRNFLNLVSTGALDTTTFSRVVPGFVIQGGNLWTSENLTNELKWRALRTIRDEPNQILHERGVLSMARPDEPDSARTSFFILLRSASALDNKFAAFGRVIQGMDVVEAINKGEVEGETPKDPERILKATAAECTPR
ncbi:MAG: peptidylprolyl isomerase [Acidobacteria bacterium]|nr:MAG: peptidylprolyl isomerase [Acidobacteriota bacterium]REK01645.1 MAG: peptidylprolyl isomerase [Acidobacteriota bacterium]REK14601.1 MAG: peptidylprolyl isomerase [Acidobacteriota bacterium]REK45316.1 MAG: peptidylprolyl isomerase [Acidobacteriota bacterium]